MKIGIFAKTFSRPTIEGLFETIVGYEIYSAQFNLSCVGLETLPTNVPDALARRVINAAEQAKVELSAMSGTFNMAHPDPAVRRDGLTKFEVLCGITARFRIPDITLCTGTRDPVNMWKWHSDNDSKGARADMVQSIESALIAAEKNNLVLAFEPESENVVNSSRRCASASSARTIFSVGTRRSLLTRPSLERVQIIHLVGSICHGFTPLR